MIDLEVTLFLCLLTSERGPFRALKMHPVRQGLSTVCGVGCSAVRAFDEDASRTVGGRFRYRISLPYHRSLFCAPSASENAPRTPGSLFEHRVSIPYRRRGFLVRRSSENASHLVVRSTGKRVAVASERPVYPRTGQRKVAAAAEPGVHFSRPHSGYEVATPPQR